MTPPRRLRLDFDGDAIAPDLAAIDALARLQLTLRRRGVEISLRHVSTELGELIDLAGLGDVLGVEAGGEAEQGEQALGVEKEGELDDPTL